MTRAQPDPRRELLESWLQQAPANLAIDTGSLRPASDDASFRRYFRVDCGGDCTSLIIMDAPPDREDCRPFIHAAEVMHRAGLSVPRVRHADLQAGFLLLDDLGDQTYLSCLSAASADRLYGDAASALTRLQLASRPGVFPDYDRALLDRELALYPDWYVARHRGITLTDAQQKVLQSSFRLLVDNALGQPAVFVHRDWHCRNLMQLESGRNPGVLDFQDAVYGPITYDLVSVLRDAYIDWPEAQQIDWTVRYWEKARAAGLPVREDFGEFYRDFEWMGIQRQLKVIGIFARLHHRDGKSRYLDDIPRVMGYALAAARRYQALAGLVRVMEEVEARPSETRYTF